MKTRSSQLLYFLIALIVMLSTTGYKKAPQTTITLIEIQVVNAERLTECQPDTVYLSIIDPEGRLVQLNGMAAGELIGENGRVEIALLATATATPTPANPYLFSIKADAYGFLYNMKHIEITTSGKVEVVVELIDWRTLQAESHIAEPIR